MSSGVDLDQTVREVYAKFKMNKKHRFFSVRIIDNAFRVEQESMKADEEMPEQESAHGDTSNPNADACLRSLFCLLSDGKARFVFLDYPAVNSWSTSPVDKLIIIQFIPDKCNIKEKMLYASSAASIRQLCSDSSKFIQLNDLDELNSKELQDVCNRK